MRTPHLPLLLALLTSFTTAAFAQPTYTREVSRIIQGKCQQCHREGDIAPFALQSYDDAVLWAPDIKRVVNEGLMPPWKPVAGHGEFRDNYSLTTQEKQDLLAWIDGGTPKGADSDMPEPLPVRGDWVLGEPDKTIQMPEPFPTLRGRDMYRCFVLDPQLDEDKFISAVDVLPGNRKSVHHVILYLDTTGEAEQLDAKEDGPGYTCYGGPGTSLTGSINASNLSSLLSIGASLGGWAPGTRPHHLPDGIGMFLDKKAKIVMQVHYYTNLNTEPDQTRIGLYYSQKKVDRRLLYVPLVQTNLNIQPNVRDYTASFNFTVPLFLDFKVINIFPHMHLLGTEIKVEAIRNRQTVPMILIDKWDFNWQGPYNYVSAVDIPAFTQLRLTCKFDNTTSNPRNPSNPPKVVRWGEGTEDEMCLAFLGITLNNENLLR